MVGVVLLGVPPGEVTIAATNGALAEVGADGDRVPGAGVGRAERLAAGGGELDEAGSRSARRLGMIFMSRNWRT